MENRWQIVRTEYELFCTMPLGGIELGIGGPGCIGFAEVVVNVDFVTKDAALTGLGTSRTSLPMYGTVLTSSYVLFTGLLCGSTFLGGDKPLEAPITLSGDLRLK